MFDSINDIFQKFDLILSKNNKVTFLNNLKKNIFEDDTKKYINALIEYTNKNFDESEKILLELCKKYPENAVLNLNVANIYRKQGRFEDAEKYYKISININADYAITYNDYALLYMKQKKYTQAKKLLESAIEKNNSYILAYTNLVKLYIIIKHKKKLEIIEILNNAMAIDPKYISVIFRFAEFYQYCNDYENAEKYYKIAIQIDPEYTKSYKQLAKLYFIQRRYNDAIIYYNFAINKDPDDSYLFYNLGYSYFKINKLEDAEKYFNKSIEINNNSSSAIVGLGKIQYKQGNYIQAIKKFEAALAIDNNCRSAYRGMVYSYGKLNQFDKSISVVQKYLKIEPNDKAFEALNLIFKTENQKSSSELVEDKILDIINNKVKGFIIFIDLCDSTEFKKNDTDKWYSRLLHFYIQTEIVMRNTISANLSKPIDIHLLKFIGDEIMFFIPYDKENESEKFVHLGKNIMTFLENLRKELNYTYYTNIGRIDYILNYEDDENEHKNNENINIKIVITYATELLKHFFNENDPTKFDILGIEVDYTARLKELCKKNMIICNKDFKDLYNNANNYKKKFISLGEFKLKGISDDNFKLKNRDVIFIDYNDIKQKIHKKEYIAKYYENIFNTVIGRLFFE